MGVGLGGRAAMRSLRSVSGAAHSGALRIEASINGGDSRICDNKAATISVPPSWAKSLCGNNYCNLGVRLMPRWIQCWRTLATCQRLSRGSSTFSRLPN